MVVYMSKGYAKKITVITFTGSKPEFLKNIFFQRLYKGFYLFTRIGPAKILSEIICHLLTQVSI